MSSGGSETQLSPAGPDEPAVNPVLAKFASDSKSFFLDAMCALAINGITGDYVEFGSMGALSITNAWQAMQAIGVERPIWAFDSFVGLPSATGPRDQHPQWGSGGQGYGGHSESGVTAFHSTCQQQGIPRSAYTAVEGFFEDSLPRYGTDGGPVDIALAYIDCNMYSSTRTVLEFLLPRMKHGMIIGVDDYECWSPTDVSGERTALHEFTRTHPEWRLRRFKDIHWAGVSFVVEHGHLVSD